MFEDLKEIICEYVDVAPETIKEDSRFIEDLGFNSYDFMSMVGEIEEKFDVEVEERLVKASNLFLSQRVKKRRHMFAIRQEKKKAKHRGR